MKTIYKKLLFLLLLLPFSILAQNTINGTVLDIASGQPIPGVNVNVQGAKNGASTDFDGKFQLSNVKKGDKIVFSFIGYKASVVNYDSQKSITVSLSEDENQLKEVVIQVGYGTVKKKDATGAVTVLTAKDFNKGPVTSADQMIQGKVAGLQIINGGGSPGEGATIRIRSGSSLSANNDPLYVIDGVPVAAGGINGGRNPLTTINQNNIESITVLKDASATAIYGSRASNGVIIITTKKGKAGDMQVSYSGNLQVSEATNKVDALSSTQFKDFVTANGTPAQVKLLGTSDTNWQNEIYRTAIGTDHNIALSGGTDNVVYRASVGYANLNGILKRDNMQRTTLGASVTGNFLDKHLKIELNNNTSLIKNNYSNRGAVGAAISFDPSQSVRNADGTFFQWYTSPKEINQLAGKNPLSLIEQFDNFGTSYRSIGNIQTEYKMHFLPELKAVANFGYDQLSGRSYGGTSANFLNGLQGSGHNNTYENTGLRNNKLMDLFLNYNKKVASINTQFDVTGGYSYQDFRDSNDGSSYNFENNVTVPGVPVPSRVNLQSFFARTNITIADKYLITASYRRDGTSRFTESNRWANFPAVAVAWKLNEESFLKDVTSISTLKLRGGWGITGQQDIGISYPSIPLYLISNSTAQYQFGNTFYSTFRPQPYNSNLKWEQTTTVNAGLDYGLFNNRLTGSVDLYRRTTKDLLLYTQNPSFFGFSNYDNYNVGTIENKGIELLAEVIPVRTQDLEWRIGGNVTFQDSKITKLTTTQPNTPGINVGGIAGGTGNTIQNHQVGYAPSSFFVYEQAYGADGKPLDGVFVDRNKDGIITEQDKYRFHKPAADVFYGFNTSVTYKNFDFGMNWRGSWGNYMYNNVNSNFGTSNNVLLRQTDLSNGVANLLESGFTKQTDFQLHSDYYVQDASFIRLDNVSVGYTFNQKPNSTSLVKLTLSAQNVLLITDYSGLDPEISGGIDNTLYPRPITFTLGLNVNF
ncbi:iron complex outermembrane receptor protein [Flavobacterium sp. CG_23.5]|uniref:SusC/RagA family TonB-linked outer membrane protein n=1 Tax=unclassified Flavobacterium TaxID=196869 RepID=UPI0018CAE02B|nr:MULTISPECIES: SusC/RagA family TonB-linked outer membrane protein [unclassified Flavobacterium]MBG6109376.1 iron complex outermembrane receptor protein [Flavobacterium sp. CG_9.10]MBP2283377.1 iron complex outermembrane receptor protein [Flavobacterium sp. CG_23.5]